MNQRLVLEYLFRLVEKDPTFHVMRGMRVNDVNSFPYIPTSETIISAIIKDLGIFHKDLLDKKEKSFIDLGCGYSLIPMIFSFYDFKVVGLEKSLELIKVKIITLT